MPATAELPTASPRRGQVPARIARGLAALVLAELPISLTERELDGRTELTCRVRDLTVELCAAFGLDEAGTAPAVIGHVLDHLAAYVPGLDAPPLQPLLPAQPLCDPVRAWIVNRLGDASEHYPEVVVPLLRRAAEDYRPALEDSDA